VKEDIAPCCSHQISLASGWQIRLELVETHEFEYAEKLTVSDALAISSSPIPTKNDHGQSVNRFISQVIKVDN